MFIPMWLVVLLVLFAAFGVWSLIFVVGFLAKMIDGVLKMPNREQNQNNGN